MSFTSWEWNRAQRICDNVVKRIGFLYPSRTYPYTVDKKGNPSSCYLEGETSSGDANIHGYCNPKGQCSGIFLEHYQPAMPSPEASMDYAKEIERKLREKDIDCLLDELHPHKDWDYAQEKAIKEFGKFKGFIRQQTLKGKSLKVQSWGDHGHYSCDIESIAKLNKAIDVIEEIV